MNKQDATQINATLRELLELHLGEEMDTDDLVELLPASIAESYSDEDLYQIVEDYCDIESPEDGFVFFGTATTPYKVFRKLPEGARCDLRDVKRIYFSIGGFCGGTSSIEITREPSGAHIEAQHHKYYCDREVATSTLTDDEYAQLLETFTACEVLAWESEYSSMTLDGTGWELLLEFPEHLVFVSSGSNACPKGFNALLKEMIDCGLPEEYRDYEKEFSVWTE